MKTNDPLTTEQKKTRSLLRKIVKQWAQAAYKWIQTKEHIDQVLIATLVKKIYCGESIPESVREKYLRHLMEMRGLLKPQESGGDYGKLIQSILKDKDKPELKKPIQEPEEFDDLEEFDGLSDEILPRA